MATTVTPAQIALEFPEFDEIVAGDVVKVQAKIDDAARRLSEEQWGTLFNDGVKYLACHLIALSPFGEQSKLELKSGPEAGTMTTTYFLEYKRMMRSIAAGCRVI